MKEMKNTISQYENKFDYFNDYINNIKKETEKEKNMVYIYTKENF